MLQRIEDVSLMCGKRIMALKQQLMKPSRPIQTVVPEQAKPLQPAPQCIRPGRILKKANTMPRVTTVDLDPGALSAFPSYQARTPNLFAFKKIFRRNCRWKWA